jgi:hypothetical protein
MKIDQTEMKQLAAAQPRRFDMYTGIHKALRALMADTLLAVGRMDVADDLDLAQCTQRVIELLEFCGSHLRHENEFVHTAIEARAPGASSAIAHDHGHHEEHIARLSIAAGSLSSMAPDARPAAALELYRQLALFIADNFQHMNVEETAHNAVLWARYTDPELVQIHGALLASIPPDEMMFTARWLVPFMNPAERTAVVGDMRANAPAPAFAAMLDVVRPHLSDREWVKLADSLGLPPAAAW